MSKSAHRVRTWVSWIWALLPLLFALPAPLCFWWAAHRLRRRELALEASAYLVVCIVWITLTNQHSSAVSDAGATLAVAAAVVSCIRALMLRRRVFEPAPTHPDFVPVPAAPGQESVAWTPSFPGQHPVPRDPNNPATWVPAVACTGSDRHTLSIPWKHTIWPAIGGVLIIAFDVQLHIYGRGLGLGIGLVLTPVFAWLFARWVDGPVLYYRNWGRVHQLSLDTVTAVGARATSLVLSAPGLSEPVRVSVMSRAFSLPPAARDHLRGWLGAPHVQWAPRARALLDGSLSLQPMRPRRVQRALAVTLGFVVPVVAVGAGAWIVYHRNQARQIPGASGYRRFGGPHGKLLAVGRPWGHACQPVRLSVEEHVPDWVYQQVALVTGEAHADGINITVETRDFRWSPSLLRYPPGTSPSTVPRVGIFAHYENPPHLSNGHVEHIGLGWDAAVDPDGNHEDLTYAKGDLWMQVLNGHPDAVRRSIRQLIAMTQGIISTTRHDSGIANGALVDRFTPSDIAAMKVMSGCG